MKFSFFLLVFAWCIPFHYGSAQMVPKTYKDLNDQYEKRNFEACIKLENDIEVFAKTQHDTLAANSFFYLGEAYHQLGQLDKAISWFDRERNLRAQLGLTKTESYSNSLYNLAYLNLQAGHYEQAGKNAFQLIENDKKIYGATTKEFISTVLNATDIFIQLDKFNEAEKLLQSTLKQQPKNSSEQGILLSKLGDLYTLTNQFSKAAKALQAAVAILAKKPGKNSPEYISAIINQGILHMSRGQFPEAEESFDYALNQIKPQDDSYEALLNNQALVYQSLGQLSQAEKTFLEIKDMDSVSLGVSHPEFAITLSNLGLVYGDEGKYKAAERVLVQALEIQKKSTEAKSVSYARKLNNLAKIYRMAGDVHKSIPLHEEALAIFKNLLGENSPEYATTAFNLGLAYWKIGEGSLALRYLKTSASIRASSLGKKHSKYAESLQKIGEYQWEQKQFKDASKSFGEVFDNYYYQIDVTFPVLTEEEKARFYYTNIRPSVEKFNSFAIQFYKEDPTVLGEVYNHQINTKGAIMYATEKVKEAILLSKDTSLMKAFELWQSQKEYIAKLFGQNIENRSLDSLIEYTSQLEKDLTRKSSVFANEFIRKRNSWQEVQKTLKPDEAAVEVVRFKLYSPARGGEFQNQVNYAFLIVTPETQNQPDLVLLNTGNELEGKFLKYYKNSIQFIIEDRQSYQNYFKVLGDYLKQHQIHKIYFSPDGVYNQININTIKDPEERKFLIDEFDFRTLNNTRELVDRKTMKSNGQSSLLMGFPKFNVESAVASASPNQVGEQASGGITRTMRGGLLRYMRGSDGIRELPGTQKEIQQISQLISHPQICLGESASEGTLKKVDSPSIMHIATHGYFLEEDDLYQRSTEGRSTYIPNPLLKSGIILSGAENFLKTGTPVDTAGNDGILTAYEAMNLNLDNTELVVLSACETGLGVVKNGEGVYGLQRAFKLAGAQHIIMSLWSVDDNATQELMTLFYKEKLTNNDLHEAFRAAQQKLKEKYHDPFYWGAFVMIGI